MDAKRIPEMTENAEVAREEQTRNEDRTEQTKTTPMPFGEDAFRSIFEKLKKASHRSWGDLRRVIENKPHKTVKVKAASEAFYKRIKDETGLTDKGILEWLDRNGH